MTSQIAFAMRLISLAVVTLLWGVATASADTQDLYTFEQRRHWILDTVTVDAEAWIKSNKQEDNPFFAASACFARGMDEKGREIARKGYAFWTAHPKPNWSASDADERRKTGAADLDDRNNLRLVDFFRLWPAMDCYVRNKDKLDEKTKADFKKFMTGINFYAYSTTANLSMMMWTARHLGEQEWGADAFVPLVRDTTSHYQSNPDIPFRERLLEKINDIARTGGPEYASRDYGTGNIAPLLTLADLSKDPEIKLRARMAHESVLARYAAVWLRGSLILTSRRSYPDMFEDPMGFTAYLWVFLGGDLVSSDKPITTQTPMFNIIGPCLDAAVLGRDVPHLIQEIARDRSRPYEARNRFEEMSSGRQISWIDSNYGVFSEAFHTNPRPFSQTYPFGVRWIDRDSTHHTVLWFSVPMLDKANYQRISNPHGFNLDAQTTFQHEGTILYVVNTEPKGRRVEYPYGLCYVPGGMLAVIDESRQAGRVFLHYPGVMLAISSTKPFSWDRNAPVRMPNAHAPLPPDDSEFRIEGPRFAAAIETAPLREYPAASPEERLAAFRTAVIAKSTVKLLAGETLVGSYTCRDGAVIQRQFAGPATINGEPVDFDHWPLAESRWVKQATKDSPLVVTDGEATRTYDLRRWTVSEYKDEQATGERP